MRKLIMWNIVTLDGYFEGEKNWDLRFHELVWGKELEEFIPLVLVCNEDLLTFKMGQSVCNRGLLKRVA